MLARCERKKYPKSRGGGAGGGGKGRVRYGLVWLAAKMEVALETSGKAGDRCFRAHLRAK